MKDSTIRLIIQGALALVALVGIIVLGAIDNDSRALQVLELVLVAGIAFFLGHQGGRTNGTAAKNGD